jgi:hypothetical protein
MIKSFIINLIVLVFLVGCGGGGSEGSVEVVDEVGNSDISRSFVLSSYYALNSDKNYDQWLYDSTQQTSISQYFSLWNQETTPSLLVSKAVINDDVIKKSIMIESTFVTGSQVEEGTLICTLQNYHDSKIFSPDGIITYDYNDVLEILCKKESVMTLTLKDGRVLKNLVNSDIYTLYWAKNLGEVAYENSNCHYRYEDDLDDNFVNDGSNSCSFTEKFYRYLKL